MEDYQSILDIGIDSGGRYLEVHAVDAAGMQEGHKGAPTDFAPAFQEAQHRLSCTKPSPTSLAFLQGTDCAPVVEACNKAGYYLGCQNFSLKGGLLGTCLGPIVFGRKSLPDVEVSSLEASACRNYCIQNPGRCN